MEEKTTETIDDWEFAKVRRIRMDEAPVWEEMKAAAKIWRTLHPTASIETREVLVSELAVILLG